MKKISYALCSLLDIIYTADIIQCEMQKQNTVFY